jgi:hypothetical protein
MLNPSASEIDLAEVPLGMVRQVNDRRGQLATDFQNRFDSSAERDAKLSFNDINSKDAVVPPRAGYQLGSWWFASCRRSTRFRPWPIGLRQMQKRKSSRLSNSLVPCEETNEAPHVGLISCGAHHVMLDAKRAAREGRRRDALAQRDEGVRLGDTWDRIACRGEPLAPLRRADARRQQCGATPSHRHAPTL